MSDLLTMNGLDLDGALALGVFAGPLTVVLGLIYLSALPDQKRGAILLWAAALAVLVAADAMVMAGLTPLGQILHEMAEVARVAGALLAVAAAHRFNDRPLPTPWLLLGGLAAVLWAVLTAATATASGEMVPHLLAAAALALAAWEVLRGARPPLGPYRYVAAALAAWAVLSAVLGAVEGAAGMLTLRLLAVAAAGTVTGVGMAVLALRAQAVLLDEARAAARASENAAAERAMHLRQLVDSLPEAMLAVDAAGLVREINPSAERLFGFPRADLVGRDAGDLLPVKGGMAEAGGQVLRLAREPDYFDRRPATERVAVQRGGGLLPVSVTVNTLTAGGRPLHVALVRNVSQEVFAERLGAFFDALDDKIIRGRRTDEIDSDTCGALAGIFDLPLVALIGRERDEAYVLRAAAGVACPPERTQAISGRLSALTGSGSLVREAVRTGVAQVVAGEQAANTAAQAVLSLFAGADWAVLLPVWMQDDVAGVLLCLGAGAKPEETTLHRLETVAARVGVGWQTVIDQQQLRLQGTAMAAAANAIFITDRDGRIEWVNAAFTRLSGYAAEEVIGRTPSVLRSGTQDNAFYQKLWETIAAGQVWRGEMVERRKDGSSYAVDQTVAPILDENGEVAHFVAVHEDITERKRAEERILYLSNYDTLTRLPNRVLFRDNLYQSVTQARNTRTQLAVLFVDLDHFSRVNDTLGHGVGDQLLMTLASRINAVAAPHADTVARLGGDEFAIIQSRLPNAEAASMLARRVIDAVNNPVDIDGLEVRVGANVGIAIFPQDGEDPDHLIKNADMAMYRAIRSENESCFFFSNEMNAEARIRLSLEGDLRRALERGNMELYYQPQVNVSQRRMVGTEALIRWNHPEQGMIPPARFIPVAEDSGLINALGDWVLDEALRQARAWEEAGLPELTVAVNISAVQFRKGALVRKVRESIDAAGINPRRLELELTESILMQDAKEAIKVLQELSDLGVLLAIDDFGTGYSSLSYLKQFPVHKLKVDQSFVRHLTTDHNDAVIARATINLGHSLGLEVIAEGVETQEQFHYLEAEGCDVVQGYLFGRPVPAQVLTERLTNEGPTLALPT